MSHVILRSENGRRARWTFGETAAAASMRTVAGTVELAIEAGDPDHPSHLRRFALVKIPRHPFSKGMPGHGFPELLIRQPGAAPMDNLGHIVNIGCSHIRLIGDRGSIERVADGREYLI